MPNPTTNYGWPYPLPGDTVDVARDVKNLAIPVDTSLKGVDNRVATLENQPSLRLTKSAAVPVASSSSTTTFLTFDAPLEDSHGMLNAGNGSVTIKKAGLYLIHMQTNWPANGTGNRALVLGYNAQVASWSDSVAGLASWTHSQVSCIMWRMGLNDVIYFGLMQSSGISLSPSATQWNMYLLKP